MLNLRYNKNSGYITVFGWPSKEDDIVTSLKTLERMYKEALRSPDLVPVATEQLHEFVVRFRIPAWTDYMPVQEREEPGTASTTNTLLLRLDDIGLDMAGEELRTALTTTAEQVAFDLELYPASRMRILGVLKRMGAAIPEGMYDEL